MTNKQLRLNIKHLDSQIKTLCEEVETLEKDNDYDIVVGKLRDLVEIREKLAKSQEDNDILSDAVKELDAQIETQANMLNGLDRDAEYNSKLNKLEELVKIRVELAESKTKDSQLPAIISGTIGLVSMLMVLNYEKDNVVTTKAFNMMPRMFRGV